MSESTDAENGEPGPYRSARFERAADGAWTAHRATATAPGRFDDLGLVDADVDEDAADADPRPQRRRRPRTPRMWLQGGTTTQHWGWVLVGSALIGLGAGVLAATAATTLIGGLLGAWIGTIVLWLAMLVPVIVAYSRSVPRGLLRFRATDLLFGLLLGLGLRLVSGWFEQLALGTAPWPAFATSNGSLSGVDWLVDVIVPVAISPVVEEFFFHGFLLVALYSVFRRLTRQPSVAGAGAALVSSGVFVMLHQLTGSLANGWAGAASIALVGIAGAVLVLVTGRFWGALIAHIVFNGSYVVLALVGTLVGASTGVTVA